MDERLTSVFDSEFQNKNIDARIIGSLERISQVFRSLLWKEGNRHKLSPIQIQVLTFLLYHPRQLCKSVYLAQEFNLTKATISIVTETLLKKGFTSNEKDEKDKRSHFIQLTEKGREVAQEVSRFANLINAPLDRLSPKEKTALLSSLIRFIYQLNQEVLVSLQRMCFNCRFYVEKGRDKHYCQLMNKPLKVTEIRIDCPEHSK